MSPDPDRLLVFQHLSPHGPIEGLKEALRKDSADNITEEVESKDSPSKKRKRDNDDDDDDDVEREDNYLSGASRELIEKTIHLFETWESQVSWDETMSSLPTTAFRYQAFSLGCEAHEETENAMPDAFDLIPDYKSLFAMVHLAIDKKEGAPLLSVSVLQYFLWFLIGFQKSALDRTNFVFPKKTDSPSFTSRTLSVSEFKKKLSYEQQQGQNAAAPSCCIFVSHRWNTPEHPDRDGGQANIIEKFVDRVQEWLDAIQSPSRSANILQKLKAKVESNVRDDDDSEEHQEDLLVFAMSKILVEEELLFAIQLYVRGQRTVRLWYDYYSIPQGQDEASRSIRKACLPEIEILCRDMLFLGLISSDYFARGWCAFELIQHLGVQHRVGCKLLLDQDKTIPVPTGHIDEDSVQYMEQRIVEFQARFLHGRVCALLEEDGNQATASELLHRLGMSCTNGSDLEFVSSILVNQAKQQNNESLLTWVHPFVSAIGQVLETFLVPARKTQHSADLFVKLCLEWIEELSDGSQETSDNDVGLPACVTLKWRYPDHCLDHLLQTKVDFESNIPGYKERLQESSSFLTDVRHIVQGKSLFETWESVADGSTPSPRMPELDSRLDTLLQLPGYFIQVKFHR